MSQKTIHYFGIRHHGPGSTQRLLTALNKLQPRQVLIEGPADCGELISMLAHQQMQPPVALLAYATVDPSCSLFFPFAEYSPEYQACRWAIDNGADVQFIDLPASVRLAQQLEAKTTEEEPQDDIELSAEDSQLESESEPSHEQAELTRLAFDPIGVLAELAGYEDGESWWNDLIEQNQEEDETAIFTMVEVAMAALREKLSAAEKINVSDIQREAFMRLEIAKQSKSIDGSVAVVCGAWHVPALKEKHAAKADREILKQLPKKLPPSKLKSTWIPWTSPRLASASGYGAGVSSPMWYQHLWEHRDDKALTEHWLGKVTHALRASGQVVSTASVIEAVRLSQSLASVRERPNPGFEEIREAAVACLCFGEPIVWQQLENDLLLGNMVGRIPDDAALVPLLEDLQNQQKKTKLKPEALDKEISLDLRSDIGLAKSILLHRLLVLEVPWGRMADVGGSRGTFRERWVLSWQPEYAVKLVENLVYGSTLEQAANNKLAESLNVETDLAKLAEAVLLSLESQLVFAAETGIARLSERAAHTSDALEILEALPPLVRTQRYGTARDLSLDHIVALLERLAIQAAIALPYASRQLNTEESVHFCRSLSQAHQSLELAELEESIMNEWWQALASVVDNSASSFQVAGLCARLLYTAKKLDQEAIQGLLQKNLSPAIPVADAAQFFEGFFAEAAQRLQYDTVLLETVERWILQLEESVFVECLPLFRRVFSSLDAVERKRLMDTILEGQSRMRSDQTINASLLPQWSSHLERMGKLIRRDKSWAQ